MQKKGLIVYPFTRLSIKTLSGFKVLFWGVEGFVTQECHEMTIDHFLHEITQLFFDDHIKKCLGQFC